MKLQELKTLFEGTGGDAVLTRLYGGQAQTLAAQRARYLAALDAFASIYGGAGDVFLFSVGGRSEISGNHTDHNHGRVIAAAVDLDIIAVAARRADDVVSVKSEGFPADRVSLAGYPAPREKEFFSSRALIAGVAAGLRRAGFAAGGFDAYTTSDVLGGSGLSSSAAFEDMIGNIQNHLFNDGAVPAPELAKISQYAENVFFGKPCGLMDQTACAVGGFVAIDFADPDDPVIEPIDFDLSAAGYSLCIVSTGGSHADLNDDYAAVPAEMKAVAAFFGRDTLRGLTEPELIAAIPALRARCGDRAILRALHFLAENERVLRQTEALRKGELSTFLGLVRASGESSYKYLQNVYTTKKPDEQGLSLALCLSERLLRDLPAAWRVHGGGFAGTVQAFVPHGDVADYRAAMDAAFGPGACRVLSVRVPGAVRLF